MTSSDNDWDITPPYPLPNRPASRYLLCSEELVLAKFPECEAYLDRNLTWWALSRRAMSGGGATGAQAAVDLERHFGSLS